MNFNVIVSSVGDGIGATSLQFHDGIENVLVKHHKVDGKDEVEVKVNGKVVFRYDANRKGCYMKNNIQTPIVEGELSNATIRNVDASKITTESISDTSI